MAGIRSTGLTCAPAIGEYVAELFVALRDGSTPVHASLRPSLQSPARSPSAGAADSEAPPADGCPLGVTKAAHSAEPLQTRGAQANAPVPDLAELAADYQRRGDGRVMLYGASRRVTHPVASFGMGSMPVKPERGQP